MRALLIGLILLPACSKPSTDTAAVIPAPSNAPSTAASASNPTTAPDPNEGALAPDVQPLERGVVLQAHAERTGHAQGVIIRGETNLPDETKIGGEIKVPDEYAVSTSIEAVVTRGRFHTAPTDLSDGEYVVEMMVVAGNDAQPADVQKVLGANGERLRGKLVHRDAIATSIEMTTEPFIVGDDKVKARDEARAARAQTKASLQAISKDLREIVVRWQRATRASNPECIRQLSTDLKRIRALEAPLDHLALTIPAVAALREAASEALSCGGCAAGSTYTCNEALVALGKAGDELTHGRR